MCNVNVNVNVNVCKFRSVFAKKKYQFRPPSIHTLTDSFLYAKENERSYRQQLFAYIYI